MPEIQTPTRVRNFSQGNASTVDLTDHGNRRRHAATLLEVDVTNARRKMRMANRGGESTVSFVAWLVGSVARALRDHPDVRPVVAGLRRTAGEAVAITLLVDRTVGEHRRAIPVMIQNAASRSIREIESAIQHASSEPVDVATFVAGKSHGPGVTIYRALPAVMRRGILQRALRRRNRLARVRGHAVISSSGMGGRVKGWFIPTGNYPMCIGIGAVTRRAVVINGTIEPREILHMSVLVDTRVVGAAPALRWMTTLLRSMETARELQLI